MSQDAITTHMAVGFWRGLPGLLALLGFMGVLFTVYNELDKTNSGQTKDISLLHERTVELESSYEAILSGIAELKFDVKAITQGLTVQSSKVEALEKDRMERAITREKILEQFEIIKQQVKELRQNELENPYRPLPPARGG